MTDKTLAEQMAELTEHQVLAAVNEYLASKANTTPPTAQEMDDNAFYESVYPSSRDPRLGPVHSRPHVD